MMGAECMGRYYYVVIANNGGVLRKSKVNRCTLADVLRSAQMECRAWHDAVAGNVSRYIIMESLGMSRIAKVVYNGGVMGASSEPLDGDTLMSAAL